MSNLNDQLQPTADSVPAARLAEPAGSEHLGASLYELQSGQGMIFHYHLQRERRECQSQQINPPSRHPKRLLTQGMG